MKKFLAFSIALLLGTPAFAATTWTIDPAKSLIEFEGTQMDAPFKGHFKDFDGAIQFDADHLDTSKADITIHLKTVDSGSTDRDKYVVMPDWFNTDKFPDAHFVTTAITKDKEADHYIATGKLTIRDVTLPLTLPFTLTIKDKQAVMKGETSINRLDYGVGQGDWKDTKTVGNPIKILVSVTASKP
jgi:cytochrome b561